MEELEKVKSELIDKTTEKVMSELNSKFITYEEMQKAMKEYASNKDVYSAEPGLLTKNIKAMVEGTGSAGGYFVPVEYVNRIMDVAIQQALVYPKVTKIPFASNQANMTGVSAAVSFAYPGEAAAPLAVAPTLTQTAISIKKGMALIDISNELLRDATIGGAVDAYIVSLLGRAYGKEMDRIITVGNTVSGDPFMGILNTAGIVSVVEAVGNTTTVSYDALVDTTLAASRDYTLSPMFLGSRAFFASLRKVKTTYGQPIFDPESKTLLGYPFAILEVMPSAITASQPIALFGDPATLIFGTRNELEILASKEAKFALDVTSLRATYRFATYAPYPATWAKLVTSAT